MCARSGRCELSGGGGTMPDSVELLNGELRITESRIQGDVSQCCGSQKMSSLRGRAGAQQGGGLSRCGGKPYKTGGPRRSCAEKK